MNKENRVTVENIVNLRQIKHKKKKKGNKLDNNTIFKERLEKIGIIYDNLLQFESHFESGNLQLAYITDTTDEKYSLNNNIYMNTDSNINNLNNNDINDISITDRRNINKNNSLLNSFIRNEVIEKYELFLHNDTNTSGYTQWFFFRVSNTKKGKKINLNIMNLLRKRTKYSNGIKIWCYSRKNSEINKIGWHHTTEEVKYYKNFLYKLNKGKKEFYYTLSFDYTFQFDNDEVFFANCIPYTYTDLTRDLNVYTKNENDKYIFFNRKKLCSTIIGNEVEYFNINNSSIFSFSTNNNPNNKPKNGIVLFARQHPSETVGSWTLKGAMDFLMGESDEANYLRDNFIFKIIPMINVDGVICGNTRTSLSGCDLNRRWSNPNILLHPEIYSAKEIIIEFCKKYKIECIVDFHGHFGAFNSFFYGNHKEDNLSSCKFFPFSCAKKSKVIQFEKSKFKMPKYKKGTGRINLFKELDVENVVTLETSYFGCNSGGYSNQYFNIETLEEIGRDICNGILLFHYHSNLELGIKNDLNNYPLLQKKVENDEKVINSQFTEYLNKIKNIKNDDNDSEEDNNENKSTNSMNEDENEENNNDYSNDSVSDSESDPSGDNLEESEIIKLLPPIKKLKKNIGKNNKNRKINRRNLIFLNQNSNNNNNNKNLSNGISLQKNNNNNEINNLGFYSLPKVKDNLNKNKLNNINIYNSIDINSKVKRDIIISDNEKFNIKKNINFLNKTEKDISAKNILFKINQNTPNIKSIINNRENIKINMQRSTNNNINIKTAEKSTQTEEAFFKFGWRNFIGMYRIITPKIEKYPIENNLGPIRYNSIKNSYSYTNRKNFVYNNSIIPPQKIQRQPKYNPDKNILNMMKMAKFNFDTISNDKVNKGNRNNSMIPYGSLYNNLIEKTENKIKTGYGYFTNQDKIIDLKTKNRPKIVNYPVVNSKGLFLKNINDIKESN